MLRRPQQPSAPRKHKSTHSPHQNPSRKNTQSKHHPNTSLHHSINNKQSSRLNQRLPYLFRIPLNRFGDVIYIVTPVALNGSLGESAEYATRFDNSKGMSKVFLSMLHLTGTFSYILSKSFSYTELQATEKFPKRDRFSRSLDSPTYCRSSSYRMLRKFFGETKARDNITNLITSVLDEYLNLD